MSIFADNIQKLRVSRALSQRALADKLGVSKSTVGNWESSDALPDFDGMGKVAQFFGVAVSDLFAESLNVDSLVPYIDVPLYRRIAAGAPLEMDRVEDSFPIPQYLARQYPGSFLLKVTGESMNRILPNGSYALIDPSKNTKADIINRHIYAICINGYDATVKRVTRLTNGFELSPMSTDPTIKPRVFDNEDRREENELHLIGEVVWYTVPFDFIREFEYEVVRL